MVRERVDPDIGDPEAPRRPWVRWTAVLVACALAGVVTGLVIAGARNSPPVAVQWNSSMYMAKREKPIRWPSMTARSWSGTQSMPVSSATSFTATSAGE